MNTQHSSLTHTTPFAAQRGFTLLEILISLLILSVGLLGLAGLQLNGLRSNQDSYYLSQAMAQAYDMADRMRANIAGVNVTVAPITGYYDNITTAIPGDPNCILAGCTAVQMAQYDAFQWNTANSNLLPNGKGTVARVGNVLTITVMWDQLRNGATTTGCGVGPTAATDLTCFTTSFQP